MQNEETTREKHNWWIPFTMTTQSELKFDNAQPKMWFQDSLTIANPASPNDWFMLNLQAAGIVNDQSLVCFWVFFIQMIL